MTQTVRSIELLIANRSEIAFAGARKKFYQACMQSPATPAGGSYWFFRGMRGIISLLARARPQLPRSMRWITMLLSAPAVAATAINSPPVALLDGDDVRHPRRREEAGQERKRLRGTDRS